MQLVPVECLFLAKQGFLALGVNEWSLPGHRSSGRMTDAVGRSSFSLSSYGFVGVPARNADLAGLRLRIREVERGVLGEREQSGWESARCMQVRIHYT